MPISYGSFEKQMKLLPLVLHADGRASITVRIGFMENGTFNPVSEQVFEMSAEEVAATLDSSATPGLSRRDDLSLAIYTHLVEKGVVPLGTIT